MTNRNIRVTIHWERLILLILACWCVIGVAVWWWHRPMSYYAFTNQSQSYFARVADDCENLRAQTIPGAAKRKMNGSDPTLSSSIRELKCKSVEVDIARVKIIMRDGRAPWGILWDRSAYDKSLWELTVQSLDAKKIMFSRINRAAAKR
jgi:hypothetical protein